MKYLLTITFGFIFWSSTTADESHRHGEHKFTVHDRMAYQTFGKFSLSQVKLFDSNRRILNNTLVERNDVRYSTPDTNSVTGGQRSSPRYEDESFIYQKSEKKTKHMTNFTMSVTILNETFTLDLNINRFLLASEYTEVIVSSIGNTKNDIDLFATHCYYLGSVRGYENSTAAVSTCNGIVGGFFIEDEYYYIEPEGDSEVCLSCRHKVYKSSDQPQELKQLGCGLHSLNHSTNLFNRRKRATITEWPQGLDGVTRIVEVYVVNDYYQYQTTGSNVATVMARAKDIVNTASLRYHSEDIYLVLVGQEVWTDTQRIPLNTASSNNLLRDFCNYVKANSSGTILKHDEALYITSQGPYDGGNVVGLAYIGTMCGDQSCAFVADIYTLLDAAEVAAHEMGHNFGLQHDGQAPYCPACDDPSGLCIMNPSGNGANVKWSTCSKTILKSNNTYKSFACLNNMPQTLYDPTSPAVCGNGLVETGEQCDCGQAPIDECNPACCSNTTCQIIAPAQCAFGKCCDVPTCKFTPKYTECRASAGLCDVSEYCSGADHLCPSDVYKANFISCTIAANPGYCYGGQCNNRQNQCQTLFADGTAANDVCYTYWNSLTPSGYAGNCGFAAPRSYDTYVACATADVFCGLAQCLGGAIQYPYYITGNSSVSGNPCRIVQFNVPLSDGNRGYIQNGSPCGVDKVCENQVCKNLVDVTTGGTCSNCNNNGVCNSLNQCHCNEGYAPPQCNVPGEGGSLHSNAIAPLPSTAAGTTTMTTTTTATSTGTPTVTSTQTTSSTGTPTVTSTQTTSNTGTPTVTKTQTTSSIGTPTVTRTQTIGTTTTTKLVTNTFSSAKLTSEQTSSMTVTSAITQAPISQNIQSVASTQTMTNTNTQANLSAGTQTINTTGLSTLITNTQPVVSIKTETTHSGAIASTQAQSSSTMNTGYSVRGDVTTSTTKLSSKVTSDDNKTSLDSTMADITLARSLESSIATQERVTKSNIISSTTLLSENSFQTSVRSSRARDTEEITESSSTTVSQDVTTKRPHGNDKNIWIIVGSVLGGIAGVLAISCCLYYFCYRSTSFTPIRLVPRQVFVTRPVVYARPAMVRPVAYQEETFRRPALRYGGPIYSRPYGFFL